MHGEEIGIQQLYTIQAILHCMVVLSIFVLPVIPLWQYLIHLCLTGLCIFLQTIGAQHGLRLLDMALETSLDTTVLFTDVL